MQEGVCITVNGAPRRVRAHIHLAELLEELGLPARGVAVERNRKLVRAQDLAGTELFEGDELELVTLVGGG